VYQDGLGDLKKAVDTFQRYVKACEAKSDAPAVMLRIAKLQAESGDHKEAVKTYDAFVSKMDKRATSARCSWRGATSPSICARAATRRAADKELDKLIKDYDKLGETRRRTRRS